MSVSKRSFYGLIAVAMSVTAASAQQYSWKHLPVVTAPVFKKDTINILKYGARPDGITLNTEIINKAITACSAKGGGVVLIPQGLRDRW